MVIVLCLLGAALGIAAELHSAAGLRQALPDLVTGWMLLGAGLLVWRRRAERFNGPLLGLTGVTWFAGNLTPAALFVHRGPLLHGLFSDPDGRPGSRLRFVAVVVAYAVALVEPVWAGEPATLVLCVAAVAVAAREYDRARGAARRRRRQALVAIASLAVVLGCGAIARLAFPGGEADEGALLAYEAVLCAIAISAVVGRAPEPDPLTDLVVELEERPSDGLRDALAQALGDPTLEVGRWDGASGRYLDARGGWLALDHPGRAVTPVQRNGGPRAVLVHDPAVLEDPALVEAVQSATRMALSNADLQERVRAQLDELRASRRRLLVAGDDERLRLEQRLHEGARRRLSELDDTLATLRGGSDGAAGARIDRAESLLARARDDLDALARGLHPRTVVEGGLAGALRSLVESSALPIDLDVTSERFDAELETGAYFVCAEAVSNATKHADATRLRVSAHRDGDRLVVEIADDGTGGVERVASLSDRVETLGGRLELASPRGEGTRVTVALPVIRPSANPDLHRALR
jgi:signal transduction histidine kinase